MRSNVVALALVAALGSALPARAGELKIGVVNLQRAVEESDEGKAAEKKLRELKDKLEGTLNRKLKEYYEKEKKLREAWSVLKDDERRARGAKSQQEMEALQKEYLGAERELGQRRADAMMKITDKLNAVIQKIAKSEKFDYIFANAAVLWAPRHVDITNEVIRLYNGSKK